MRPNVAQPSDYHNASLPANDAPSVGLTGRLSDLYSRHRGLIRYALVGSIGYVIYIAALALMYDLELVPLLPARHSSVDLLLFTHNDSLLLITTLLATEASIVAVFIGHSLWTFADVTEHKPLWQRFAQFEARALVSTLGILTLTVNAAVLAGVQHYVAVGLSIVVTFTWNWFWDSKVVWRKDKGL
ncbi:MAG: GtrA family protein [Chloroflexota bacterium]